MEGDSTASGHGNHSGVVESENDWGLGDEVLEDLALRAILRAFTAALEPPMPCTIVAPLLASPPLFELVELGAYLLVLSLPQVITSMKPHGALAM
jgi:hypothetical protein